MFTNTLSAKAKDSLALLGQKKILPFGTYLAGGSALALHFGHRISVDFDFFTQEGFDSDRVVRELKKLGGFELERVAKDTLLGRFEEIRLSLFRYQYPLLFKPTSFQGIDISDVRDITAMKIAAIMDRGTKKDFIDLYFIVNRGLSLEKCLKYYDKKYKALANNIYSIITSLSYFVDAEESEMPKMLTNVDWGRIKTFFEKEAIRLAKKYL